MCAWMLFISFVPVQVNFCSPQDCDELFLFWVPHGTHLPEHSSPLAPAFCQLEGSWVSKRDLGPWLIAHWLMMQPDGRRHLSLDAHWCNLCVKLLVPDHSFPSLRLRLFIKGHLMTKRNTVWGHQIGLSSWNLKVQLSWGGGHRFDSLL